MAHPRSFFFTKNRLTRLKKQQKEYIILNNLKIAKIYQSKTWKIIRELVYILRNLKKMTRLLRSISTIKKLTILILYQKNLTNFSVAMLTRFNKPSLTNSIGEFHHKTYLTRSVLPSIHLDQPTPHEFYNTIANLKAKKINWG